MVSFFSFGSKLNFKEGKALLRNDIISGYNAAAIGGAAKWNGGNNFTSVGSNGAPSYYGTFDQTGNCFEWVDSPGNSFKAIRGGDLDGWASKIAGYDATKATRYTKTVAGGSVNPPRFVQNSNKNKGKPQDQDWGGRIATSANPLSLSGFVTVGDAGNTADTNGYGAVSYSFMIGKYTLTNDVYCSFLNTVAASDPRSLYSTQMSSERVGGITRSGSSGSYTYSVKSNYGNKPVYFLSWFSLARYCNWLHNNYGSLETGAYTLNNASTGIIHKNGDALYWIPSENEWYKAAYYKGNGTNKGYWKFATQSDTTPLEVNASAIGDGTVKIINVSSPTSTGNNIVIPKVTDVVNDVGVAFNFSNISSTGTTVVSPLPQYGPPSLPANFYLSNTLAKYNLSTTAAHSGDITVCFTLPSTTSLATFNKVRILHKEANQKVVDTTILSGAQAPSFSTKTICAKVTNFSDFYAITEETPNLDIAAPSGSPSGSPDIGSIYIPPPSAINEDAYGHRLLVDAGNDRYFSQEYLIGDGIPIDLSIDGLPDGTGYTIQTVEMTPSGASQPSPPSAPIAVISSDTYSTYSASLSIDYIP